MNVTTIVTVLHYLYAFRIVTPRQWGSFSHHNTARAEAELQVSARIREAINQTIRQTVTDLEAQWTVTNYAFRKRVHEIEQAKTELEWQKEKVSFIRSKSNNN